MFRSAFKIVFLILLLTPRISSVSTSMKHKTKVNYKFKLEYVSEEFDGRSHSQCLAYCSMRPGCISASFKSPTESCLLSVKDTIDDSQRPVLLDFAEGWTTMTRMVYPAFHTIGIYLTNYAMTFEEAKQQCIDYGTTIASPSDMLEARAIGYERCACGWLSNKRNGFVLQKHHDGCYEFNDKIIYCEKSRADVYCKLK